MKHLTYLFLIILMFSCVSKPEKQEEPQKTVLDATTDQAIEPVLKKTGFRYDVPDDMEEAPNEARLYRFNNLLIDRGTRPQQSTRIIAIRHVTEYVEYKLLDFAQMDQKNFYNDKYAVYEKGWEPPGLSDKKIEHVCFEFMYIDRTVRVYQRSVYIKYDNVFYIISLSSLIKSNIIDEKNDFFWRSIRVD
jgi:hypothetical protein